MEHRRVGLVRVAAIDAAGRDDAKWRLLLKHGADLHRARMGAEYRPRAVRPLGEIEGVVILPRGMLRRNVERGEIVEVGLDVGAFGDGETHIGEDLGDLVCDLAHRVDAALGERAFAHRQGDIGALTREPRAQRRAAKRLALGFQRLSDALFELIDRLPEALALFRRYAPERLHQLRDAALLAECRDAHLFERAKVCRLGDSAKQLALDPLERSSLSRGRLGHGGLKLKPWPQLTRPRPGSGRLLARARRYRQAPCGRARCRPCSGRR